MSERTVAGGRYVLSEQPIGAGGMGTVWKAFDTVLHREVAVKELRIPDGLNPEERDKLRSRAMREARAAAGLDHPGIVTIHDVVDEGGRPWIVMRLLPGKSLDQAVGTDGPLSPRRAAELGVRLLEALTTAHANGVLHRDVKPQNVMLGADGRWMLTDFGIASVAGATRTLTVTGMVTGTLGYVAPERLSGAEPGAPADLWALGATLYFAVEGQHAYDHDDLPAMIAAVLTRDPNPPKHAGPLAPVIAGLMERDPARRLDPETAKKQLLAIAGGYPTFENPTVRSSGADAPTERFGGGTKVLPGGGPWIDQGFQPPEPGSGGLGYIGGHRVLRALAWLQVALNGAIGALLGLILYALSQGMPIWIAVALVVAIGLGGWLGAALVPRLARRVGVPTALIGSALLMGEFIVGAGLGGRSETPLASIILSGAALVSFAGWHRLSRSVRDRMVPPAMLSRVTAAHRRTGFAAILFGVAVAGVYFGLAGRHRFDTDNVVTTLVSAGIVVIVTALLAIPAVRTASTTASSGRPKRWALVATCVAALILPTFVGVQATVYYIDGLDDFTSVPDICTSDALSEDRVAEFVGSSPEPDAYTGSSYARCDWRRAEDDVADLQIDVDLYDNSRAAARSMQKEGDRLERDGKTTIDVQLGDEGFRHWYDGTINSEDTAGVSVEVRVENVVLEADFDHAEDLGAPDADKLETLVSELVRELESRQPQR